MSERYKVHDETQAYFITFATEKWVDVFTRPVYRDIIIKSLKHCQKEKGLVIHAWCLMTNHLHLIASTIGVNKLADIIRDFKKYTAVHVCREIEDNEQESRREWMLQIFRDSANESGKHQKYKFWQNEYHPVKLYSNIVIDQKVDYVHANPIKEGFVENPEEYLYSSARDYAGRKGFLEIVFAD